MLSPATGVTVNEVPVPPGSGVVEPGAEFEQVSTAVYWLMLETEPVAIASVRV